MMRFKTCLLALWPALLLTSAAIRAQMPAETPEAVRQYAVEVIVFVYEQDVGSGSEVFVAETPPQSADDPSTLAESQENESAQPENPANDAAIVPFSFNRLRPDELTMGETYGRLNRLQAYKPVMHFGWTQPTIPEHLTPELALNRFGRVPRGLHGELKLYLSRYLHLVVDLSLDAPANAADSYRGPVVVPEAVYGDRRQLGNRNEPLRYRLQESRIMRNGEVRYYDHPKFGVIAKVTRIDDIETGQAAR